MAITCLKDGHIYSARLAVKGGRVIDSIYYGGHKVLDSEGFVYIDTAPGIKTIHIPLAGVYNIHLVGGGGGGSSSASDISEAWHTAAGSGGSGAHVWWWQYLDIGDYEVTIGDRGDRVEGVYGSRTGGDGGDTIFFSQIAGGGKGGFSQGSAEDGSFAGGAGGTYTTDFNGTNGNAGSGGWGHREGGASVYGSYGRGGGSGVDDGMTGVISLVFKDSHAPNIFESSTPGTYTVEITEAGKYEITVVGAGGGGATGSDSNKYAYKSRASSGGSGAAVVGVWDLEVGSYTVTIGAGGAGSGNGMWTLNTGKTGGSSSFGSYITCNGGTGGKAVWTDQGGTAAGTGGAVSNVTGYTSLIQSTNGNNGVVLGGHSGWTNGGNSVYGGYGRAGQAYCDGGGGGTSAGGSGYVRVAQLEGKGS